MPNKKAYALFKNDKLVDCCFARSRAVRHVDEHLGDGLFSPKWDGNKKGDYEIVPCEVSYGKLYILPHKGQRPQMFASLEDILAILKDGNVRIKRKIIRAKSFDIQTERGTLKGEIIQVK